MERDQIRTVQTGDNAISDAPSKRFRVAHREFRLLRGHMPSRKGRTDTERVARVGDPDTKQWPAKGTSAHPTECSLNWPIGGMGLDRLNQAGGVPCQLGKSVRPNRLGDPDQIPPWIQVGRVRVHDRPQSTAKQVAYHRTPDWASNGVAHMGSREARVHHEAAP